MKLAVNIFLFSVAVFILTAVGLAFLYYKTLVLPFWFVLVYIVALVLVFAFAIDSVVGGVRLSKNKFLLLTFGVMVISTLVTHSVWTVVTPRWTFLVFTNKSTYSLGEDATITVYLENTGLITHSFRSGVTNPVVISVEQHVMHQVWYSAFQENVTEFSISPSQSLKRTFTWNQTQKRYGHYLPESVEPGEYYIRAFIPDDSDFPIGTQVLFSVWTSINITTPL